MAASKKTKIRWSVVRKFIGVVSLCLIVILFAAGFILIQIQERALLEERVNSGQHVADFLADISAFYIGRFAYSMLDDQTIQIQSGNGADQKLNVLSALIYDIRGRQLNPSGIPHEQITVPKKFWRIEERACIFQEQDSEPKEVGKLVIVFFIGINLSPNGGITRLVDSVRFPDDHLVRRCHCDHGHAHDYEPPQTLNNGFRSHCGREL